MIRDKKVIVVLPAYNAERTLEQTVLEISGAVDACILVDDRSSDGTVELAGRLGLQVHVHARNRGYGGNQKTCYAAALEAGADIVVMLHPDYQYSPLLVAPMASMIAYGVYDVVLGSRILGGGALRGGMPRYKYVANRALTLIQNAALRAKLSEYHTGLRAYSRELLLSLPLEANSDDFIFDNQLLAQCIYLDARIGELSCPTRYFPEASSINLQRSVKYGLGVLKTTADCLAARAGFYRTPVFRFPLLQLQAREEYTSQSAEEPS
ncbi:MAG TPA: glycosyltransferase family 2 protein [Terracidiphilus sp.]|nr:glycosyltransferase family 2 protein [Terracidiphilus sp.]